MDITMTKEAAPVEMINSEKEEATLEILMMTNLNNQSKVKCKKLLSPPKNLKKNKSPKNLKV